MFVFLHDAEDGEGFYLSIHHMISIAEDREQKCSIICTDEGVEYHVIESAKAIINQIQRVNKLCLV